ncbi:MAG: N-acetylmuramoyl-L-alanine amidase [Candidatus Cloacimonetes bacterium]|nr:N-acetylmuramoyl-L-alanine amidase [Candidatus Cloacimonadota bacterium]
MRRAVFFFLFLVYVLSTDASLRVEYNTSLAPEIINTEKIEGEEYFNVFELNKAFKAHIKEDILDQRLKINIYDNQLVVLINASYLFHGNKLYNCGQPVLARQGKYYLPVSFLTDILPLLYPEQISYDSNVIRAATPVDSSIRKIVIDPGHGGKDPGAVGFSKENYEKDIVLRIALYLKKLLREKTDLDVVLTRESDDFVSLQERTQLANRANADLFVSLHCNANLSNKVNGIEVYYLSTAITDEDRAAEALENSVVYDFEGGEEAVKRYDDLAFILADMAQNEQLVESYELSSILQNNLVSSVDCRNNGVRQANFYVLRGAYMPAVLVELGYLTNKEEEKKLINESYQDKLAQAIYHGIKNFKYKFDQIQ